MNIQEAITTVAVVPENAILVAKPPFTWAAEAMFVEMTEEGGVPTSALEMGYAYLLEKDEIESLLPYLKTKKLGPKGIAEFVIHYAVLDTSPAWIDDIPNV